MNVAIKKENYTSEEYLEIERESKEKNEYHKGKIYVMAGASPSHNLLVGNLITALNIELDEKPCYVYPSDMKLGIATENAFTYPDVTVVCGEPEFLDDKDDVLQNPTVLFEVLSSSTEAFDRGKKFKQYQTLESLKEYVLVSQDHVCLEKFRKEGRFWVYSQEKELENSLSLESISCKFSLSRVYKKIRFEKER